MVHTSSPPRARAAVLVIIALCVSGLLLALVGAARASGETTLTLVPVGQVRAGELITVRLVARNARDLAGFQGSVRYDTAGLRLTGASVDEGLGQGGRDVLPMGPVMSEGQVALGAATCPIGDCASQEPALARRVEGGVNGQVTLGTLEFVSQAPGSYNLSLDGVIFVDPQGNPLAVQAESLELLVRAP